MKKSRAKKTKMEENKLKIILGGGIAGLLWAYYHPEYYIFTDQIGGQFASKFQLGPKYIHVDDNTKRLFDDLDVKILVKKIKVGFYYNGKLHSENTEENRKRYFEKTRGSSSEVYRSVMSGNKSEFDSFDISTNDLLEIIKPKLKNRIIFNKIAKISCQRKTVKNQDSKKYQYLKLVSTIPLNIFLNLAGYKWLSNQFKSHPTTFILSDRQPVLIPDFQDFDYVYFSEPHILYHRITKTSDGFVFEFKGDNISKMAFEKDRVILPVGQLIQNEYDLDIQNVKFFGRYAKWQHGLLVNDLLKEIYAAERS